jgi:hypothetical protein
VVLGVMVVLEVMEVPVVVMVALHLELVLVWAR